MFAQMKLARIQRNARSMIKALVLCLVGVSEVCWSARLKTDADRNLKQSWQMVTLSASVIDEKSKDCYRSLSEFGACLQGFMGAFGALDSELTLLPSELVENKPDRSYRSKLWQFGSLALYQDTQFARSARRIDELVDQAKKFLEERNTVFLELFISRSVDFQQLAQQLRLFQTEFNKRETAKRVSDQEVVAGFLTGIVGSEDAYYRLIPTQHYEYLNKQPVSERAALGFRFAFTQEGFWRVTHVEDIAKGAGLRQGDLITKVGPVDLAEQGYLVAFDHMYQADQNSSHVGLTVLRSGSNRLVKLHYGTVSEPFLDSAIARSSDGTQVGYIKIYSFDEGKVCEPFVRALLKFKQASISSVVIDLRMNPGGDVEEVACIATALFGLNRPVLSTQREIVTSLSLIAKTGLSEDDLKPLLENQGFFKVSALQDKYSLSASEVLLALFQDYAPERYVSIGTITGGKGSFQSIRRKMGNPSLMEFQTGGIYRVNGRTPENVGVVPDFDIPWRIGGEDESEFQMTQAERLWLNWKTPRSFNSPLRRSLNNEIVKNVGLCIDHNSLATRQAQLLGSDTTFDYRKSFAVEAARCLSQISPR